MRNDEQTAECIRHSDIVFNLVGRNYETKSVSFGMVLYFWLIINARNFSFTDVHAAGAERIAKITAELGVPRFVHVSHLNASPSSTSAYYKSKAEGEERVRKAFSDATIVRPGPMYGYEDKFLNNMACKHSSHYALSFTI
jgi:NADH dehydrogenase (ubiquinone) 1 alpha subcomplex subunit 9